MGYTKLTIKAYIENILSILSFENIAWNFIFYS